MPRQNKPPDSQNHPHGAPDWTNPARTPYIIGERCGPETWPVRRASSLLGTTGTRHIHTRMNTDPQPGANAGFSPKRPVLH